MGEWRGERVDEVVQQVEVRITGDGVVLVDGVMVEDDGSRELHEVAVHAVAQRVAAPLGRPVAVAAQDETGLTHLWVHPDGHADILDNLPRDNCPEGSVEDDCARLEQLYAAPTAAPAPTATPAAARQATSQGAPVDLVAPFVPGGGPEARSFLSRHEDVSPARSGWRGFLTRVGVRTGPGEAERLERAEVRSVARHWPGPRTIAVVNGKGGAGKTPTTVILSALFARHGGSGVLAWDNNETRGTLGWRTEQGPHEGHVLELLPYTGRLMQPDARAADLVAFVHHQSDDKFDVLRSNPLLLPHQQRLTAADFDAIHQVAAKYYRLIFVDSGNDETAPHWLRMIDRADQLVVPTTTRPDHAEAGRLLLQALAERDERSAALADGAVVIVSQADREEASAAAIAAEFTSMQGVARAAVQVPYDPAIRAPWLRLSALRPATQAAYRKAATAVADGL